MNNLLIFVNNITFSILFLLGSNYDLKKKQIPNIIILIGFIIRIVILILSFDENPLKITKILYDFLIIIMIILCYLKKWIGAGDLKLLILYIFYGFSKTKNSFFLNSKIFDIMQFFLCFFGFMIILTFFFYQKSYDMKNLKEKKIPLCPIFFFCFVMSLIF